MSEQTIDLSVVDTPEISSFLNVQLLENLTRLVTAGSDLLSRESKKRDILRRAQTFLTFKHVFSTQGRYGIVGLLELKSGPSRPPVPVVFKLSLDLDRSIEHEQLVSSTLNALRPYCPHFVGNLGLINLPVSNDFVDEPKEHSLFRSSNDYFPCSVLLMEYVSPISMYHACKYLSHDKSIIISLLCQVLLAIDIAQVKCQLTMYDLHIDNILIRQIHEDTLFLYRHRDKSILLPTFGLYPVIIDLGQSYVQAVEGNPMYTQVDNYHNGLQPTLFDNLNDVHHFLISVLAILQDRGYVYDYLYTRFLYLFRHVPIMASSGWKQLPHDILSLVLTKIEQECPVIVDQSVWEFSEDIVEITNGLIILPWLEEGETEFEDCIGDFVGQLQKIYEMKAVERSDDILYILREMVDSINSLRDQYETDPAGTIQAFERDWRRRINVIIHNNAKEVPKDLDFGLLWSSALKVADRLSSNYYHYVQDHTEIISDAYLQTPLRCPSDAVRVLLQQATPSFKVSRTQSIYIWDSKAEKKTIVIPSQLTDAQLEELNSATILRKGDLLLQMLGMN